MGGSGPQGEETSFSCFLSADDSIEHLRCVHLNIDGLYEEGGMDH